MKSKLLALFAIVAISVSMPFVYAQAEVTTDIPINLDGSQLVIIGLGAAGGITTAYLGWKKSPDQEKFDGRKFLRPVVVAVLISIPLAITAAAGFVELNLVTMFMIYMASIGTAVLSKEVR